MNSTASTIAPGATRSHIIRGVGFAFAAALIAGGLTSALFWPVVSFGGVLGLVLSTLPAATAAQRLVPLGLALLCYAALMLVLMLFSGRDLFLGLGWPTIHGTAATQLTIFASALGLGGVTLCGLGLSSRR